MATRADRFRSEEQRRGRAGRTRAAGKRLKKSAWGRDKAHAASKATHAFEETAPGAHPSRESTRGSANRAKADTAMNLTEETTKGSPDNRARRFRAKGTKVRGRRR